MRIISLLLIGALVLLTPAMVSALSLGVSATVESGTSLGDAVLLKCAGYNFDPEGDPFAQCENLGTSASSLVLDFGTLETRLLDAGGNPTIGADCFYSPYFYFVYLYPDAWGGKGYELKQGTASLPIQIRDSVTFVRVYSEDDMYVWGPGPGDRAAQGPLTSEEASWNPHLTTVTPLLAKNGGLIIKAKRPRIVRAAYGIPSKPAAGDIRPTGWQAVPLTTAAGTYSASLTISLTEW